MHLLKPVVVPKPALYVGAPHHGNQPHRVTPEPDVFLAIPSNRPPCSAGGRSGRYAGSLRYLPMADKPPAGTSGGEPSHQASPHPEHAQPTPTPTLAAPTPLQPHQQPSGTEPVDRRAGVRPPKPNKRSEGVDSGSSK
jgi:hypothetical protein